MGTVFIAVVPALAVIHFMGWREWAGFLVGLVALAAAWFGGERFILRQVTILLDTTKRLALGDLNARTKMGKVPGELGQLARTFDTLAESLQKRATEHETAERQLVNRAAQQTVVAALGQYALVGSDLHALLNQAAMLVGQTLDAEFCHINEILSDGDRTLMRAGVGWKRGTVGNAIEYNTNDTQSGLTLTTGEPLVVKDYREERRFKISPLLLEHGILSGVTVPIAPRQRTFGVLGVYSSKPRVFTNEEVHFLISAATALALAVERNRAESELQRLAVFAQLNPNPALEFASDGAITYFNDAALKLALSVQKAHPRDVLPPKYQEILDVCLRTGYSKSQMQTRVEGRTFSWSFHPVAANRVVHCYVEDITDRLNLEGQLLQSQKMESVGQLAAGVAHDFNNMLTIIQGHAGMLMARPNLPPEMFDSAQTVYYASERAASLTRQLLMFSRKNVMQTKPLDMREIVSNLSKMLRRILGETVTLDFKPPEELPVVVGDDGMMEQVIMNLSVNARDAMPRGGLLTISLDHMVVEENDVQTNPEARAGEFVVLRVTDTGTGMDRTTMCRIFEPFFTTKEVGKGTGLGLATVYGIVKQHDGWVEVASEVGQGTTFTIFLPASHETAKAGKTGDDPIAPVTGGTETILVVEDEVVIREMAQTLLEELGYKILLAENGREAMEVWERNHESIDLLLTDMVMPEGVSGMELAEQLLAQKPGLKVVFASGYTVDEVSEEFLARNNARFLQKPYNRASLSRAVRQAFDEVTATRAAD